MDPYKQRDARQGNPVSTHLFISHVGRAVHLGQNYRACQSVTWTWLKPMTATH